MNKNCKNCSIDLTIENTAKITKNRFRNICKGCDSKRSVVSARDNSDRRKKYMNEYVRRRGIVKQYPCLTCGKECYKKYAKAFCSDICRFMSFVKKNDSGCWIWQGAKGRRGYGKFSIIGNPHGVASRISYELFKGSIEDNKYVCHTCDIPSCVNPDHLWAGTHVENMMDMVDKDRQYTKLGSLEVYDIRKLWEQGYSQKKIMEIYKVSSSQISNIVARRIWKHI